MLPDHLVEFNGLFSRGPVDVIPRDHLRTASNIRFITGGFETRWGTSISITSVPGVLRWFPYKIEGQVNRLLYLDTTGKIFDSLYPGVAILNIPNMFDFSMVVFNDRAYISPHDRKRGLSGQVVYIYQGGGTTARPAAGTRPLGFTLQVTTSSQSGNVEQGTHLFAIAFETDSGFITAPGPEVFARYDSAGNASVRLSNIGLGPVGTVARHILGTKVIQNYNGDQNGPELFFIEGAILPNNSATEIDINFYDDDLFRSADYLRDEMGNIPAVLGLGSYQGSLVGWGVPGDDSTVYISKAGEPESVSLINGGIEVDISEGGGVRNCTEYRGLLMIHKSTRSYSTYNTGTEPSGWPTPVSVDRGVGTEIFGIAAIMDDEGSTVDTYVIAARKGLLLYDGTFQNNLTDKIDDVWKRITKQYFNTIQVVMDTDNQVLYCAVPLDGANSPNTILFGNFEKGLDPKNIRWSTWTFPYSPTTVGIDTDSNFKPVFKIGSINGSIYFLDPANANDNITAIPVPTFQTGYIGSPDVAVTLFGALGLRVSGTGILDIEISGLDDNNTLRPPSLSLVANPGKILIREVNFQNHVASFKFWTDSAGEKFKVTRITIYHAPYWAEEPA